MFTDYIRKLRIHIRLASSHIHAIEEMLMRTAVMIWSAAPRSMESSRIRESVICAFVKKPRCTSYNAIEAITFFLGCIYVWVQVPCLVRRLSSLCSMQDNCRLALNMDFLIRVIQRNLG